MTRWRSGEAAVFTAAVALARVHALTTRSCTADPVVNHTDAIYEQRAEYERRVVGFFSEALR